MSGPEELQAKGPVNAVSAACTLSAMVVDALSEPDAAVTVTVNVPMVAALLAANVTPLVVAVGLASNAAVTPLGKPDAVRVTLPANGLTSETVMVSLLLAPSATETDDAAGASEKLPTPVPPPLEELPPQPANAIATKKAGAKRNLSDIGPTFFQDGLCTNSIRTRSFAFTAMEKPIALSE